MTGNILGLLAINIAIAIIVVAVQLLAKFVRWVILSIGGDLR